MSENNSGGAAPAPAGAPDEKTGKNELQLDQLIELLSPHFGPLIAATERQARRTLFVTGLLLALIAIVLSAIAAYALWLRDVDTAEKVLIGLISFLGGAAMFSGAAKK